MKNPKFSVIVAFFTLYALITLLRDGEPLANLDVSNVQERTTQLCEGIIDPDTHKIVSDAEREATKDFIATASQGNPSFGLADYFNTKKLDTSKLINGFISTGAPWAVFLILSIFGWLSYCCCCCCDKCCPPSKCCRRDLELQPYTNKDLLIPLVFALVFSTVVIGASVAGLVYSPGIGHGLRALRCSFMDALNSLVQTSETFPGILGLQDRIKKLADDLDVFMARTVEIFGTKNSIQMQTQKTELIKTIDDYKTSTDNPAISVVYDKLGDGTMAVAPYESFYSKQNVFNVILGNVKPTELMNDPPQPAFAAQLKQLEDDGLVPEKLVLQTYYDKLIPLMSNMEDATQPFVEGGFKEAINSGITSAQTLMDSVNKAADDLYTNTQVLEDAANAISQALQGIFAACLFFSILIILGGLLAGFLKKYKMRVLVHCGWCFYCLFMIVGFLLGTILNPVSVASLEVCDYLNAWLHDETFFQQSNILEGPNKELCYSCFYGDGDLMKNLGVVTQLGQIQGLVDAVQEFSKSLKEIEKSNERNVIGEVLAKDTAIITNLQDGTYTDQNPLITGLPQELKERIAGFNAKAGLGCIELEQNPGACSGSTPTDPKDPSKSDIAGPCWHPSLLIKQSNFNSLCVPQQADAQIFKTWFQQQFDGWTPISTIQASIISSHMDLDGIFWTYLSDIDKYIVDISAFVSKTIDPKDGVLSGVSCHILLQVFSSIYDALCVLFIPSIYRTTVILILVSISMFFGSLASCCMGLRYSKVPQIDPNAVVPMQKEKDVELSKLNEPGQHEKAEEA